MTGAKKALPVLQVSGGKVLIILGGQLIHITRKQEEFLYGMIYRDTKTCEGGVAAPRWPVDGSAAVS